MIVRNSSLKIRIIRNNYVMSCKGWKIGFIPGREGGRKGGREEGKKGMKERKKEGRKEGRKGGRE